jgi:hypothetical protein
MLGLALAGLLGCGPLSWIPGGAIGGTPKPGPPDWSFSDAVETVQLETRPGDPYSVNVWGVGLGSRFYVAASSRESAWARNIVADPRVRLRVGEDLFELRAIPTDDPAEIAAFAAGLERKYDYEIGPELKSGDAMLFRLEPR